MGRLRKILTGHWEKPKKDEMGIAVWYSKEVPWRKGHPFKESYLLQLVEEGKAKVLEGDGPFLVVQILNGLDENSFNQELG